MEYDPKESQFIRLDFLYGYISVKYPCYNSIVYYALDADFDALEKMKLLVKHIETLIKSKKHDDFIESIKEQ